MTTITDPSRRSDEQLARAAAGGSRRAFEGLVDRYAGAVARVLGDRLGDRDRAEDLTQDVWVRVLRGLSGWRPGRGFRSWLFGIALNAARDEERRRGRSPVAFVERVPDAPETSGRFEREDVELDADVERALAAVPEPFRTALALVDREQLDYDEVAASLGCAVGTVKSRVSRGRTAFREAWARLARSAGRESNLGART